MSVGRQPPVACPWGAARLAAARLRRSEVLGVGVGRCSYLPGDTPFPGRFRRRGVAPFVPSNPPPRRARAACILAACQTARDCMSRSGVAVRTCRMLKPCFLAVDMTDLRSAKIRAPSRVRKPPEIFILTFIIRRSCSARLLVKGTSKSVRKRSVSVLNFFSLSSRLWPGRCLRRPRVFDFVSNAGSPR